jgi:hypothetical protein
MYLEAKVQTAKISGFFDGIEMDVVDRQVIKPTGGRPQYKCKVVRGWPGIDELRALRRDKEAGRVSEQDLQQYAAQIQLPNEDQVIPLIVLDITGKKGFKTLLAEVVAQPQQP